MPGVAEGISSNHFWYPARHLKFITDICGSLGFRWVPLDTFVFLEVF